MQWVIYCGAWVDSICCWLSGSSKQCDDTYTEENMRVKWYLIHRRWAVKEGTVVTVDQSDDPIDAVLASSEGEAEHIAEARHGWKPNEWPRAYICESRQSQKFAAIVNDARNVQVDEFKKFMTLESKRVSKES